MGCRCGSLPRSPLPGRRQVQGRGAVEGERRGVSRRRSVAGGAGAGGVRAGDDGDGREPSASGRSGAARRVASLSPSSTSVAKSQDDLFHIQKLWLELAHVVSYLREEELETVRNALQIAYGAHKGQKRKSGDPYIIHPVAVACILGELQVRYLLSQPSLCLCHPLSLFFDERRYLSRKSTGKETE